MGKKFWRILFNLTFIIVPADGLAPDGARASAGTVMTKLKTQICTGIVIMNTIIWTALWLAGGSDASQSEAMLENGHPQADIWIQ